MGLTEQINAGSVDNFNVLESLKGQAVFILDPLGQIISCNKKAEKITGYTMHEMPGMPVSDLYAKQLVENGVLLHDLNSARENAVYTNERSFKNKDGNSFSANIILTALYDAKGLVNHFMLQCIDIAALQKKSTDIFHLAGLVERTTDAVFSTDLSFTILSWNKAAEKLYDYKAEEVIGRTLKDVVRPKISEAVFKNINDGVKLHGSWKGEVVHMAKDDTLLDIEESVSVTRNSLDQVNGYVWICRDITEFKKNERELLHLARLIENTNDAIYTTSTSNTILSWNKAAEKMYGFTEEEVLYKGTLEILQPQIADSDRLEIRSSIENKGYWKGEVMHKRKNGSIFPILASVNVVRNGDGSIEELLCICTDITELKNKEAALWKMQEQITKLTQEKLDKSLKEIADYKYALDEACIVAVTDENGIIKYVNENFCKTSKYSSDELIGQDHRIVNSGYHPRAFIKNLWNIIASGNIWNGEIKNKTKDGNYYWVDTTIVPFLDGNGKPYQYLAIRTDITEKKRAEEALKHSEEIKSLVMKSALDAIVCIDAAGKIIVWNPQAETIFGWKEQEAMGKLLTETIIPLQHRQAHKKGLEHYHTTGEGPVLSKVIEITALNRAGKEFPVELAIVPLKQNGDEFFCAFIRDITERKNWEEKLLQQRGLLRTLIDNIPDYIYVKDLEFKYLINNKANVDLIGAPSEDETLGKTVFDFFKKEQAELYMQDDLAIIKNKASVINREENLLANTGTEAWLHTTKVPLKDINNNIIGVVGISRDITQQKKQERQLIKEKELSDSIINSLPGVFYLFDENRKFLRWNRQFEIVTGYSAEEISNMTPDMFYTGDDKQYINERIEIVFEKGISDAEALFTTKTGERIPYYFTGVNVFFDNNPCVLGTGIDITERKEAEKRLIESEQKYKMLFDSNPLPMWMFTLPERNIIEVNNAAVNHYGYSKEEFLKLNLADMRPKEDIPHFIEEIKHASTGIRRAGMWRHMKKDGTIIHVEIFRDDIIYKGKKVRLVLVNDITEKLETEEKLKESYNELRSLASHLQDIREDERAVIAREIHDELGQQITGLKMDVSWISKRMQSEDKIIQQKIKSVMELLDETVKTVRKIATELRPSILDDLGLIDALQWYSLEFEKRFGIAVSFQTAVDEVTTPKNAAIGLFRIYQESLTNVARHASATFVSAEIFVKENVLKLIISDNGKGFNPGKTVNKKTLGLLGMKERTLMMGGIYEISSVPGKGTTVHVSVPL